MFRFIIIGIVTIIVTVIVIMTSAAHKDCDNPLIKGNISDRGEKIYHVPGQKYYNDTQITKKGELMFCTESAAQDAGFRKSGL